MKNISKIIIVIILATNILFSSCKKSEQIEMTLSTKDDIENYSSGDRASWFVIVAVAYIIINISEGKYHKTTTYDPSTGNVIGIIEDCIGIGHCKIQVRSTHNGLSLSSEVFDEDYDCEGNAYFAKTSDNRLLLCVDNTRENEIIQDRLFYADSIEISRPLTIINGDVLKSLNYTPDTKIQIYGKYKTYNDGEKKYIIIN
ncbi:MAG: hypothetical protein IJZ87_07620 [Bacteroidales bacterium]|nr:hypothetical protein [Bacteroidales bacterium]